MAIESNMTQQVIPLQNFQVLSLNGHWNWPTAGSEEVVSVKKRLTFLWGVWQCW